MAVRMRLMRMGKKKQPVYRVVVMDQRAPRDGRYIEQIGRYDATKHPSLVEIDNERAADWLAKGAQPSETVEKLLNISGALNTMKIKTGGIHVVGVEKAAPVAQETTVDETPVEELAAEEPVVDEPVVDEPVVEEPVAEEPVAEEPVAEEPVNEPVAERSAPEASTEEE